MLMYATLLPHQKKGSDLTPQNILPLQWDSELADDREIKLPTQDELLESIKRAEARENKKLKNKNKWPHQ